MANMAVYISPPAVISAAGANAAALYQASTNTSADYCKQITLNDGTTYRVGAVDTTTLPPAKPFDTRCLRLEQAALTQLNTVIATARARFGAGRVGVVVGSCDNGSELSLAAHRGFFATGVFSAGYALSCQSAVLPARFAGRVALVGGPVIAVAAACAGSASAIARGAELVATGAADAMIAGGVDIASETVLRGFGALETLSNTPSIPFSANRQGINLGEAAAFFVLSREPLVEGSVLLAGWGESADAYHITAPEPSGRGAAQAMLAALTMAGIAPDDVGYVNLHGTGTKQNDAMEARAMAAVFPDATRSRLPVSSTKPLMGHTLGAAGALECALCHCVLSASAAGGDALLPAHRWDGVVDAALPMLLFARAGDTFRRGAACMSNSFAFGGCNVSLILTAP
jgi:3-oxoacyl-[acyl-carrier-protein] synthase-1